LPLKGVFCGNDLEDAKKARKSSRMWGQLYRFMRERGRIQKESETYGKDAERKGYGGKVPFAPIHWVSIV